MAFFACWHDEESSEEDADDDSNFEEMRQWCLLHGDKNVFNITGNDCHGDVFVVDAGDQQHNSVCGGSVGNANRGNDGNANSPQEDMMATVASQERNFGFTHTRGKK